MAVQVDMRGRGRDGGHSAAVGDTDTALPQEVAILRNVSFVLMSCLRAASKKVYIDAHVATSDTLQQITNFSYVVCLGNYHVHVQMRQILQPALELWSLRFHQFLLAHAEDREAHVRVQL